MKRQVYEIDIYGYLKNIHVIRDGEETKHVIVDPPQGLYRAKWTGTEWIEDMTQEEINELNNVMQEPTTEERLAAIEEVMMMLI